MRALKDLLSEVLQVDPSEIMDESSPKTIGSWDSFNALVLVSELEEAYNVTFSTEEVTQVTCVSDIKEALKRHGVTGFE